MPKDLSKLFCPSSIAIIGASRDPAKIGAILLKNILESGFKGKIYPINPNTDTISDLKSYKSISDVPEIPEVALIAVPAKVTSEVLGELGTKGVKNVVVIASGFKETGNEGIKLEQKLTEIAKKHEINLLGPNCLGFVNNLCPVNATFGDAVSEGGNLSFISQSGAIAASLFDWSKSSGLGFNEFITLGNKAVITENDILEYLHDKYSNRKPESNIAGLSQVNTIGMYLESISDGTRFLELTSEITKTNPVIILKPGKTSAAATAMQSHTGAIAGEDAVLSAVLDQAGVVRCSSMQDFFELSRAFAWETIPLGPKVTVISNAGGPGVITADAIVEEGLELMILDDNTRAQLNHALPRSASIVNPVDVLGDALSDRYAQSLEVVLQTATDSVLVILTPQIMTQIEKTAETIGELSKKYNKPIFCSFIGGNLVSQGEDILNKYKIPSFRFPERAIKTIGFMWKYKKLQEANEKVSISQSFSVQSNGSKLKGIIGNAVTAQQKTLDNVEAGEVLTTVDIKVPATKHIVSFDEAKKFVKEHKWPVVLKLSSQGLLHKKDIGGVVVDINNEAYLESSWDKLNSKIEQLDTEIQKNVKIQIQKDIINGIEVIIGFKRDTTFGDVLLFGAGGSYAELIMDRNLHLLPIDIPTAKKLVEKSKVYGLLKGKNGEPSYALDKLYEVIVKLAELAQLVPYAESIEINPAIVTLNDVWAVDGKVVLKEGETKKKPSKPKFRMASTKIHENIASTYHSYDFVPEEPFEFNPGQYISVKVADDTIRCYSIACHKGAEAFKLLVDVKPGGPGSKYFENLNKGDKITFLGPFGVFTYRPDDGAETLLFLGTGSGVSAVRCMIEAALIEHNFKGPVKLYIGLNYVEDIFWKEHFEKLSKEYPNFSFEIVIFKPNETWEGKTGFITELLKIDFPDASKCAGYLCGNKNMIQDATDILLAAGCPKERIYTEKFV